MKTWWQRQSSFERPWIMFWLFMLLLIALCLPLLVHASHTNERADPSAWIDPKPKDDGYVYKEDPCVEALRLAMELMQPFLPTVFDKQDDLWHTTQLWSQEGMTDFEEAQRVWEEVKLQCWRH